MASHEHEHDHHHDSSGDSENPVPSYYDMLETAITELLIEKGLIEAQEIRRQIEVLDSRTPALLTTRVPPHESERTADQTPAERPRRTPGAPIKRTDHPIEPWEKRCHALADVLDFRKILNTEEKRCGVEALGSEIIGQLSYYERWIVAFSNILSRKQILTPTDIALKMDEGEARCTASK